jgi:hypothetical protein
MVGGHSQNVRLDSGIISSWDFYFGNALTQGGQSVVWGRSLALTYFLKINVL